MGVGATRRTGSRNRCRVMRLPSTFVAGALLCCAASVLAQVEEQQQPEARAPRAWSIVPLVSVQETYTDNVGLRSTDRRSDWVTDVSSGVRVEGRTARLNLHLDYRLHELLYARASGATQTQQELNSRMSLTAVENLLFVDMDGAIFRQPLSPLGTQSAAAYSINSNSVETSSYRFSPYLRSRLGGYVDSEVRYSKSQTHADSSIASGLTVDAWSGRFVGDTMFSVLGWALDVSQQRSQYSRGPTNDSEQVRGMLNVRVTPELKLSASLGKERNDYLSATMESYDTRGVGFEWHPTQRTNISVFREKRFFGNGHTIALSHKWSQSVISYTDNRNVSTTPTQNNAVNLGVTNYDFKNAEYMATIPDPVARAAAVAAFFAANPAYAPNALIGTLSANLLTSQATAQRRQQLSYLIQGVRNDLTIDWLRAEDERLGSAFLVGLADLSQVTTLRQQGMSFGWVYRLTPMTSLNVTGSQMHSIGSGEGGLKATQKSLAASLSTKLGARTRAALSARRTVYDSPTNPYTENAISSAVSVEF